MNQFDVEQLKKKLLTYNCLDQTDIDTICAAARVIFCGATPSNYDWITKGLVLLYCDGTVEGAAYGETYPD
jgi:hypothetical protein